METLIDQAAKWNSKRLVAAGGAGYAIYSLAAASLVTGPLAVIAIGILSVGYIAAETWKPTTPPVKKND